MVCGQSVSGLVRQHYSNAGAGAACQRGPLALAVLHTHYDGVRPRHAGAAKRVVVKWAALHVMEAALWCGLRQVCRRLRPHKHHLRARRRKLLNGCLRGGGWVMREQGWVLQRSQQQSVGPHSPEQAMPERLVAAGPMHSRKVA